VIVLDPGHNGGNARNTARINKLVNVITERKPCDTTGAATNAGYAEHAFTWDVALRLKALLRARGAKVVLTRPDDAGVGPCITERAAIGNRARADAAVSVHADGGPPNGHGFHVIEPRPVPRHNVQIIPASRKLGLALRDSYAAATGIAYATYIGTDGLDVRDDLGGLNLSKVPKVFIECGNMRHPGDAAKLSTPAFRQRIAQSLADGLAVYFS
jgi:N-acetylmuramoyl-L-alanine amidase